MKGQKDGRVGTIADVLEASVAYLFEFETPHGKHRFDDILVYESDIARVIDPYQSAHT